MNFLFEITPDYLFGYKGNEIFRARVSYEKPFDKGITNIHVDMPLQCIMYITDGITLAQDIWKAILKHSEITVNHNKEFDAIEAQERFLG